MPRTLYIAGASKEIERAERWIAKAREAGFVITEDWPAKVRAAGSANHAPEDVLRDAAEKCEAGAITAEITWVLIPSAETPTAGAWYEMAIALAAGRKIITSLPYVPEQRCVFIFRPGVVRCGSDEGAWGVLLDMARSR